MTVRLGVVMDPIHTITPYKDTSLALLLAAQERGWTLMYMEPQDLALAGDVPVATMRPLTVRDNNDDWFDLGPAIEQPLTALDVILMRKDPPFDSEFLYSTFLLERAEARGVLVVNRPRSLRDCNEKLFATEFPQCTPPLVVSRSMDRLKAFHAEHGHVVFKPLDEMGGASIFSVRAGDSNLNVILETLTRFGTRSIMGQKFLPEIGNGDKRVLMINGEPVPYCLARIPTGGDIRGNLAAGGRGEVRPLSERDRWIAQQVGPSLREKGLFFVGLDIIGDYLTEINVTSPTCAREIDAAQNTAIGSQLMDIITAQLAQRQGPP